MRVLDIVRWLWHNVQYARKQAKRTRSFTPGPVERLGAATALLGRVGPARGPKDKA